MIVSTIITLQSTTHYLKATLSYYKDKVVWVTGASSGIGEALVRELSRLGAIIILSARSADKLQRVRQECEEPSRHEVLTLDLSDVDSLTEKADEAFSFYGRIDVLINNGGVSQRSLALDTSVEVDRTLMETNYLGPVALTKAVLPTMIARKENGHIVVISSLTGKFGTPLRSGYAASKHALHGFFDALRAEIWKEKIFVTVVCPGYIRTNVSINAMVGDGSAQGTMDKGQANGMSPEDCARRILKAVEEGKDEVLIGGMEKMGVYMKRFFPGYFSRMIRKMSVTG